MEINDIVQFTENHKWCGCIGIITEIKEFGDDTRYMIGVPIPEGGVAYIYTLKSRKEIEYIGKASLIMQ